MLVPVSDLCKVWGFICLLLIKGLTLHIWFKRRSSARNQICHSDTTEGKDRHTGDKRLKRGTSWKSAPSVLCVLGVLLFLILWEGGQVQTGPGDWFSLLKRHLHLRSHQVHRTVFYLHSLIGSRKGMVSFRFLILFYIVTTTGGRQRPNFPKTYAAILISIINNSQSKTNSNHAIQLKA